MFRKSILLLTLAIALIVAGLLLLFYQANHDLITQGYRNTQKQAGTLVYYSTIAFVASINLLLVAIAAKLFGQALNDWVRQQDGSFRIQRILTLTGIKWIDPNRMTAPSWTLTWFGKLVEHEPAAGWADQADLNNRHQVVRHAQATSPGDRTFRTYGRGPQIMPPLPGRGKQRGSLATKPDAPFLEPRIIGADPLTRTAESTAPQLSGEPSSLPPPDPVRNIATATAQSIPLGIETSTNQLVTLDLQESPHLRVHGKSQGSGKTNQIRTIVAGLLHINAQVILLDRRYFKDWHPYEHKIQKINSKHSGTVLQVMQFLHATYQERDRELGHFGAPTNEHLAHPHPKIVLVISEAGATFNHLQATGEADSVNTLLDDIMREAAATGIHIIYEDQTMDTKTWLPAARGNATPISGFLPPDMASLGGYHRAHQLQPKQFHYNHQIYNTWNMDQLEPRLLPNIRDLGEPIIDITEPPTNHEPSSQQTTTWSSPSDSDHPSTHHPPSTIHHPPLSDIQLAIHTWMDNTPDHVAHNRQKLMRDQLAAAGIEVKKSWASQVWNAYLDSQNHNNRDFDHINEHHHQPEQHHQPDNSPLPLLSPDMGETQRRPGRLGGGSGHPITNPDHARDILATNGYHDVTT